MRKDLLSYPAFFLLFLLPSIAFSQRTQQDTTFLEHSINDAVQRYRIAVGLQAHLYTGPEYYSPAKHYMTGHQFFNEKLLRKSAVFYDGTWFTDVPLLYDVVLDEVVTIHQGTGYFQKLIKEKTGAFVTDGHTFINLTADSVAGTDMPPGYYDLCYKGSVKVLARRKKEQQERATINGMEGEYLTVDKFYIWKDGIYYPVTRKSTMLKVLQDQKKELNRFARTNNLKFRKNREASIVKLAQLYDTLKK
ncbi:hypothetical protein [Pontibacter fetidus]|uniref:GLPGLI family protein n=1 Tax=Pontibacter fetidus TaxID=2700082 RepID=A0A6B2H0H2_9BACT|nr:hypothetical protein [Pontibacter fetidus]NDK56759.1 hypothetical protein [Pontibacter fetidus]